MKKLTLKQLKEFRHKAADRIRACLSTKIIDSAKLKRLNTAYHYWDNKIKEMKK